LGVNWTSLQNYAVSTQPTSLVVRGGSQVPRDADGALVAPIPGEASTMFASVMSAPEFTTIISALNTGSDSKLVSNPTIVTLNNTEASINVGMEYPIPNYTYNQERGSFEVSGFIYKPIGVLMKVTPQVNNQGFIKLNIAPEVSNQTGTVKFGASGGSAAEIPIIAVQKTLTQVTLKDGFTLGIGGMVTKGEEKNTSKVPVLGSIPYLGRLFSSDSTRMESKNLLIFITARTLKPDGATVGDVFDPRMTREMQLQKTDLPGYRDSSDPFYTPPPPAPEKPKKKSLTGK
jgi:type IV pilus assembly protein PilQ